MSPGLMATEAGAAVLEERKEMMANAQNCKETIHKRFKDW